MTFPMAPDRKAMALGKSSAHPKIRNSDFEGTAEWPRHDVPDRIVPYRAKHVEGLNDEQETDRFKATAS